MHDNITQSPPRKPPVNKDTPYANLTPDRMLDAIDGLGIRCDGRILQLNSFENRVYQVGFEDGSNRIAKFYRPKRWSDAAILEEHAFTRELADQEIPVVPPLVFSGNTLHHADGHRFALFAKQGGRSPELEQDDILEWLGRFLGRIHCVGEKATYRERPTLDLDSFGIESRHYLLGEHWLPSELQAAWTSTADLALDCIAEAYRRAGNISMLRLHGDCHPGNLLWTDDGPHFVDFDDSRTGPSIQDLWMLLSGDEQEMRRQLNALLKGYETFRDFDDRELLLIEALRTLRLLHYSAWIARRWHDPAFPAAFPWFGSIRYWQDRILELKEQIALMQAPTLF